VILSDEDDMPGTGVVAPARTADGRRRQSLLPFVESFLRTRRDADDWSVSLDGLWCRVSPVDHQPREQGWKLHVAATAASAGAVLRRSLPVLLDARPAFKFASSIEDIANLNGPHYPREGSGKFITVYPDDDEQLTELAERLHRATAGQPAPAILSDRRWRADSTVHVRFGAFSGRMSISNDGEYQSMLLDPRGELVRDRREPRFTPPPWVDSPFTAPRSAARPGGSVTLGGCFRVVEAVRHANKGGVYYGVHADGAEVVIKEARPHVAGDVRGGDARDVLRQEAAMLEQLAILGIAPRSLALFEQGGHLFLAQERVPGTTLRRWVTDTWDHEVPGPQARRIALQLSDAVRNAHEAGVVIRDLTPNNVIVTPTEDIRLIDLELAVATSADAEADLGRGRYTPGYGAPEQIAGEPASFAADAFSLGATLCYLLSGEDPIFAPDAPPVRTHRMRLAQWLRTGPRAQTISEPVTRLLVELADEDPARRSTVTEARDRLAAAPLRPAERVPRDALAELLALDDADWERAVRGILFHTLSAMDPEHRHRLWPSTIFGATSDACNVQHGAAGVLGVLCHAHATIDEEPRLLDAISVAARWIDARVGSGVRRPPGLYFGAAGIAWALHNAGLALDDGALVDRARQIALVQPADWPSPDVTHGVAGLGLTLLHLWRSTGSPALLQHANRCASTLVARAQRTEAGVSWRCPESFESRFAGKRFHGFAHGTAGIAQFLLDLGMATADDALVELASAAAEGLLVAAVDVGGGALAWPSEPDTAEEPLRYWCSGSAGIGGFFARLHVVTGDDRHRRTAEAAAVAVMQHRWRTGTAYCHGLAGNGDFLLDLAQLLGDRRYKSWAEDLAAIVWSKRIMREGYATFGDDPTALVADFNVGLGGILAFLLRLRRGGPRIWLDSGAAIR